MNRSDVRPDLVTFIKVFDVNYIADDDLKKLNGLDASGEEGVGEAVRRLLLPEFLGYTAAAQARLISSLKNALADPKEDFSDLFDRVELSFDAPIEGRASFMRVLLRSLETVDGT